MADAPLTLMTVHAHPDDEAIGTGGVLARYAAEGVRTVLVCCTRGELGEIVDPTLAQPENLAAVREAELRAACSLLDVTALDLQNLIEELQGLTKRDERALGSQLKRIMTHLLKQQYQPERTSRSWQDSVRNGREQIEDILDQSPSLRRLLPDLMAKNYPRARMQAASETHLPEDGLPATPPFSLAQVLGEDESTTV